MEKENKKQLNIPKLRFYDFSEEWEEKNMEEIFLDIKSGKDKADIDGDYILYGSTGIIGKTKLFTYNGDYILVARVGANAGKINLVSGCFGVTDNTLVLNNAKNININFFYNLLLSKDLRSLVFGSGQPLITGGQLKKIKVFSPSINEQQKIADFLSFVDNWINNLKQQKENLESYKKGMMQKIFSREVRFKDENGEDFEEWRDFLFKDIVNHFGGTALEEFVSDDGEYNFISIGNYSVDGKYLNNNQKIILNEKTKTKLLNKNDLVMVLNDKTASGDLIGSTILINEDNKFIYNQRSERIICKEVLYPIFAWHILNSKFFRSEIVKKSQGGTQIYINFGTIEKIKISIPCIEEQKNIADFLSNINNLIEIKYKEINNAEEWKKGLMQQMFV